MKQKLHAIFLMVVVFLCATSLAFAEGGKVRQQKQKRNGSSSSYQMNLDNEMMLSATPKRLKTRSKDGSCQSSFISPAGSLLLAANGNGNGGGAGKGGGEGNGPGDGNGPGESKGDGGYGPGDGSGYGGDGPADGGGFGPGEVGNGPGPGTGDCQS